MNYLREYFIGMWEAFKKLFTRIGWQGMLVAIAFALLLGVILPMCAHLSN